jgi:hypothetical protein
MSGRVGGGGGWGGAQGGGGVECLGVPDTEHRPSGLLSLPMALPRPRSQNHPRQALPWPSTPLAGPTSLCGTPTSP